MICAEALLRREAADSMVTASPTNRVKGRLGEALVCALFEEQGWSVKRLGIEHQLDLAQRPLAVTLGSSSVRDLPDFLVQPRRSERNSRCPC